MESSSFPVSSKRAKAPGHINQVAHCLVDGCDADLSLCRDYHRRHKVCEMHSKTARVTIGGREQRFCQQCSRFHSLAEFDEGKRSCRKRLDGHNRRRRKPQSDSLSRNPGFIFPSQPILTGTRLLSFGSPQILPSAVVTSSWGEGIKPEHEITLYSNNNETQLNYMERQKSFADCSPHSYKGKDELQLGGSPIVDPNAGGKGDFSDGYNQVIECDRALSLLSSTPPPPVSRGVVQRETAVEDLDFGSLGDYSFKPMHGSGGSSSVELEEMFDNGTTDKGSSRSGFHQTLTFMWE